MNGMGRLQWTWLVTVTGFVHLGCGEGDEKSKACSEGARQCAEAQAQVCVGGEWTLDTNCAASGRICSLGACVSPECSEGVRCKPGSQIAQSCSQGRWVDGADCAAAEKECSAGECVAATGCTTEAPRCKDGSDVVQTCSEGSWTEGQDCAALGKTCRVGACFNPSTKLADRVLDFAVSDSNLYVVRIGATTAKPEVVLCPLTGCDEEALVLSTFLVSDHYGIEVAGSQVVWMEKASGKPVLLRKANLDGSQVEELYSYSVGNFYSRIAVAGDRVFFGVEDALAAQIVEVVITTGESATVSGIATETAARGSIFATDTYLAFAHSNTGTSLPIAVKDLDLGTVIAAERSSRAILPNQLVIVGGGLFWLESAIDGSPLYGCSIYSDCASVIEVRPAVTGTLGTDGVRLFFTDRVQDGDSRPGAVWSCDLASALDTTCEPTLEAAAEPSDWMGKGRLRADGLAIYNVNQAGELWTIAR